MISPTVGTTLIGVKFGSMTNLQGIQQRIVQKQQDTHESVACERLESMVGDEHENNRFMDFTHK